MNDAFLLSFVSNESGVVTAPIQKADGFSSQRKSQAAKMANPYRSDPSLHFETPEAYEEAKRVLAAFEKAKGKTRDGMWVAQVRYGNALGISFGEACLRSMEGC